MRLFPAIIIGYTAFLAHSLWAPVDDEHTEKPFIKTTALSPTSSLSPILLPHTKRSRLTSGSAEDDPAISKELEQLTRSLQGRLHVREVNRSFQPITPPPSPQMRYLKRKMPVTPTQAKNIEAKRERSQKL